MNQFNIFAVFVSLLSSTRADSMVNSVLTNIVNIERESNYLWHSLTNPNPVKYNPDQDLTTVQIAVRHGYTSAETHTVKTEDGYLLTLHRIPCGRMGCKAQGGRGKGQPVFLQHGLLSSSADWLLAGPEKALGFMLADAGYDVFLGNARGNTYSRSHVSMKTDDATFWDFSWDEMAKYDLPAEIDFVYELRAMEQGKNTTERNILYIGHSMGTTMMFALLASKPEFNDKIQAMFALAPVAYMTEVKSPLRLLAPMTKSIEALFHILGANEFLPQNWILRVLAKYGCELITVEKEICENLVFIICGFDKAQYNATLFPVVFAHTPAGTSTKTVLHFAQEIYQDGHFQYYDYGDSNKEKYGQETPPLYDVDNIRTPIAFFWAQNDWLAGPKDVARLYAKLNRTSIGSFKVPFDQFNHVDFLWGIDAKTLVYRPLLNLMHRFR